jgi:hypothetical protein
MARILPWRSAPGVLHNGARARVPFLRTNRIRQTGKKMIRSDRVTPRPSESAANRTLRHRYLDQVPAQIDPPICIGIGGRGIAHSSHRQTADAMKGQG